jgi:hypothetical protein
VGQERAARELRVNPQMGWGAVRLLCFLFLIIGIADISLAFYPPHFDDKGWLFGVLGGAIGGLPVLSLGLCGGAIAGLTLKARGWTILMGVLNGLLALLIIAALVLFASVLEEARRSAPVALQLGISRTILRTFLLGGLFTLLHGTAMVVSLRGAVSGASNN